MKKSVLSVLVLILASCTLAPQTQTPQQNVDFRSGTQGLYLDFVPNLPPPRVYDRDPFNVMIQVENKGTSPLGTGTDRIYLSGFDPQIITGIPTDGMAIPPLEPRGPYVTRGGYDTVSFRGAIRSLTEKRIDKYQPLILATSCYTYETLASGQVCIDPNPYSPTSIQHICTPAAVSTASQGAPVAVTTISVDPAPGKTRFTINIQNVGGGTVFRYGNQYLNKCSPYSPGLAFDEVDFVRIEDVIISAQSIKASCKPLDKDNHLRLTNGQAQLFCEYQTQGQTAYLTPLEISLRYGYRQSIAKPIEVRPVT